jgi:hypothetical protein
VYGDEKRRSKFKNAPGIWSCLRLLALFVSLMDTPDLASQIARDWMATRTSDATMGA